MIRKKSAKPRGGPGRLSAEDAAKLPDRLLDAALEVFNEKNFADATMEQIARRAGASTKTLYARYADKAAVVEAVVN
jgi:AcrR family transcriptional regulator